MVCLPNELGGGVFLWARDAIGSAVHVNYTFTACTDGRGAGHAPNFIRWVFQWEGHFFWLFALWRIDDRIAS